MKKLEKYKIALQAKFVKFKVKHLVEIPTVHHDKAAPLPAWLPKIIFPPECVFTLALEVSSCPLPGWWHKNFPRGEDTMMWSAILIHIPYPIILYHSPNPSKWTIEWNYGHCREHFWFSFWKVSFWDNMRLKQKECVDLWLLATILHNLKN